MRGIFSKVTGVIVALIALTGISLVNVTPSTPDINGKSALFLEHGKYIGSSSGPISWHTSHGSHGSHGSHSSHSSGY
jgi:hypothetical protein